MMPMQFSEASFKHNAYDHEHEILLRDLEINYIYERMPLSFGRSPGPRQDWIGRARNLSKPTFKTGYISSSKYFGVILKLYYQ